MPRRRSVTGRRLCSVIFIGRGGGHKGVDRLAAGDLTLPYIAGGRCHHDNDGNEASETDEGQADVVSREDGPGFHLFFVTEVSVAWAAPMDKCGKPNLGKNALKLSTLP